MSNKIDERSIKIDRLSTFRNSSSPVGQSEIRPFCCAPEAEAVDLDEGGQVEVAGADDAGKIGGRRVEHLFDTEFGQNVLQFEFCFKKFFSIKPQ